MDIGSRVTLLREAHGLGRFWAKGSIFEVVGNDRALLEVKPINETDDSEWFYVAERDVRFAGMKP